jgi:two-component system LytT family sensor kinase
MTKLNDLAKIELIAFTAFAVIAFIFTAGAAVNEHISIPNHVYYNRYWINLLSSYAITCLCYFLMVFYVNVEVKVKERQTSNGVIFICILIYLCWIAGLINEYFAMLLAVKMMAVFINSNKDREKLTIAQEALMLFSLYLFLSAITNILSYHVVIRSILGILVPVAILHYLYAVHVLLPELEKTTRTGLKFSGRTLLNGSLTYLPVALLILVSNTSSQVYEFLYPLNMAAQFVVVPVVAWIVFKTRSKRDLEEIKSLKTELGKSDANLNFLKSQINPHFLFNALNTLYGTAIQENAIRTSEGIQKLGDMMRFMLEDNLADKTLLATDIEYLKNYISLQKLRIASSPNIHIETDIEETETPYLIAPMMLQPFVENAFKHGISLNNPSQIKITLQIHEGKLFFDVSNSINKVTENDPERSKGGVGLQNVKQRLGLLYPDQHELIIRENSKEFFIHLTIALTRID